MNKLYYAAGSGVLILNPVMAQEPDDSLDRLAQYGKAIPWGVNYKTAPETIDSSNTVQEWWVCVSFQDAPFGWVQVHSDLDGTPEPSEILNLDSDRFGSNPDMSQCGSYEGKRIQIKYKYSDNTVNSGNAAGFIQRRSRRN